MAFNGDHHTGIPFQPRRLTLQGLARLRRQIIFVITVKYPVADIDDEIFRRPGFRPGQSLGVRSASAATGTTGTTSTGGRFRLFRSGLASRNEQQCCQYAHKSQSHFFFLYVGIAGIRTPA